MEWGNNYGDNVVRRIWSVETNHPLLRPVSWLGARFGCAPALTVVQAAPGARATPSPDPNPSGHLPQVRANPTTHSYVMLGEAYMVINEADKVRARVRARARVGVRGRVRGRVR